MTCIVDRLYKYVEHFSGAGTDQVAVYRDDLVKDCRDAIDEIEKMRKMDDQVRILEEKFRAQIDEISDIMKHLPGRS